MRINFVHSPDPVMSEHQNFGNRYTPLWAFICASYVPERHQEGIALFDLRVCARSDVGRADLFLFSGMNQDLAEINQVRDELARRYPRARFALGGPLAWSYDKAGALDELSHFDFVCVGDGELLMPRLVEAVEAGAPGGLLKVTERFDVSKARPVHRGLLRKHHADYYGALVEVSRGCPFLCEFCDIRVMHDNNRAHNYAVDVIIEEVDTLCQLGVTTFMFACDNLIGDLQWAHALADALIAWKERTGFRPSIFTWLTINLYKDEALMRKLRRAGFDMLFIGVETFNDNSLLETAKVQNTAVTDIISVLRRIQSFGFVVTPGLIFGFDSDGPDLYDKALRGMEEAGLLTSNPGLLIALPGTPLYRRMKLAGRLREVRPHIGRFSIQSNIEFLLSRQTLIEGYLRFMDDICDGRHQLQRLRSYYEILDGPDYVAHDGGGYGNAWVFAKKVVSNPAAMGQLAKRMAAFGARPANVAYAARGAVLVARRRHQVRGGRRILTIWLYGWTNQLHQREQLSPEAFDIASIEGDIAPEHILPEGYEEVIDEEIPARKTKAQRRATVRQLTRLLADRAMATG